MNAQIFFVQGEFRLIHIPLDVYSSFLQHILKLLLPYYPSTQETPDGHIEGLNSAGKHHFLNISVTPLECSIICHYSWARDIFEPAIQKLQPVLSGASGVSISKDVYNVFSVNSSTGEAGGRVMDLTSPLAMAGVSILFNSTYYTDFIVIPAKDRQTVNQALLARGFEFSESDHKYEPPSYTHSRGPSSASQPPSTPPPSSVAELQDRILSQLRKRNIVPVVPPNLELIQCMGKEIAEEDDYIPPGAHDNGYRHPTDDSDSEPAFWTDINTRLYMRLIMALSEQPRFLSITITEEDGASLLIDKSLLRVFGASVAGDRDAVLIPILLDLAEMPLESTGIVCGVAGKIVDGMRSVESDEFAQYAKELTYLSTVRSGTVLLGRAGTNMALNALKPLHEVINSSDKQSSPMATRAA